MYLFSVQNWSPETFLQFGTFMEKDLWSQEPSGWGLPPLPASTRPLRRVLLVQVGVGVLSFLGLVWFPVPCSLGFCLEAERLFGELRVSLDAPHTEMSIVVGSHRPGTAMPFVFMEALSIRGPRLRWQWYWAWKIIDNPQMMSLWFSCFGGWERWGQRICFSNYVFLRLNLFWILCQ